MKVQSLKFKVPNCGFTFVKTEPQGFTLIELIVTVAITIVAGYLLILILGQNSTIFYKQTSSITQGMNANDAETLINDTIKQASAVAASSPTAPTFTSNINTVVLQVPSIDASGNIISNTYDYFVIAPDSTIPAVLRLRVYPTNPSSRKSENRVLLTNLASVRFLYLNSVGNQVTPTTATTINYTLNLSQKAGLIYQQSSASSQVNLRNN